MPLSTDGQRGREMQDMPDRFTARPWLEEFTWKPSTDVYRDDGDLVVRAEVPGIDPEEGLDIQVEGNVLHIKGEKKLEREISEDDRYIRECRYGSFRRDVMLPDGVNADGIAASFANGVLVVRVPVPEEAVEAPETKTITVAITEPAPAEASTGS